MTACSLTALVSMQVMGVRQLELTVGFVAVTTKAKFFDFVDENRLIFVVLSGRYQTLESDFGVLF